MGLESDQNTFAEVDLASLTGKGGLGVYRILANLRLRMNVYTGLKPDELPVLVEVVAELEVQREGEDGRHYVGTLTSTSAPDALTASLYSGDRQLSLGIDLDLRRLDAVERLRAGGHLVFHATVRGRVRRAAATGQLEKISTTQTTLRVNAGTWLEVLARVGYRETLLIEVPIPDAEDVLATPIDRLKKARSAFDRGDWREAVAGCRNALETLETALGDKGILDPASKDRSKHERYRHLRRQLLPLCHSAKHDDEVTERFVWDREDALALLTSVSAVLQRYRTL